MELPDADEVLGDDDALMMLDQPVDDDEMMMNGDPAEEVGDDEDDDGDGELVVIPSNAAQAETTAKPARPTLAQETDFEDVDQDMDDDDKSTVSQRYLSKIAKPMYKSGNTTISYAEAKLFGLLDKDGNIKTSKIKPTDINDITAKLESQTTARAFAMSNPRAPPPAPKPEAAKPLKSKAAQSAMADPGCGYDFLDKYAEKGNFLETLAAQDASRKAKSKGADDHVKADYEAKLDKLACPSCKREQSFDEWFQKKRSCGRCQERFRQINVSNATSYVKRMEAAQKKKEERLKKAENDVYGSDGKPNIGTKSSTLRPVARAASANPKSDQGVLDKIAESNKRQSDLTKTLFEKQYQGGELMFDSKQKQEQLLGKSLKK
jgi:hypothetical protein